MKLLGKVVIVGLAVGIAYLWHIATYIPPIPKLENTWWGRAKPSQPDESIRPFKINISDEILDDLARRLEFHGKLTPPLKGANFTYGFNTDTLKILVEFWRKDYKWRDREVFLNSLPQFKTRVAGLDLHYIHVKPKQVPAGTRTLPLLLLHGWPGSISEFYKVIPLLTTPRKGVDFVFEVIVPSLPGFGFSEGTTRPGLGITEVAVVIKNLMERIGHAKFYVQGGDWGAHIARHMAVLYPESVLGLHSNFCLTVTVMSIVKLLIGIVWPSIIADSDHTLHTYPVSKMLLFLLEETGYWSLYATKPDTLGVALGDSPIGLAAYLLEKFSTGTNPTWKFLPDGGLTNTHTFTFTELLDNVMIYWVTGSATTSARVYAEYVKNPHTNLIMNFIPCKVPSSCAIFPYEIAHFSESMLKATFQNLVRFTHLPRGGHFAALEVPQLFADDVWETILFMDKEKAKVI